LLIPGFEEVKIAALQSGVLGCSISGSGPSIFALATSKEIAENAGVSMKTALNTIGLDGTIYVSKINDAGAKVIG